MKTNMYQKYVLFEISGKILGWIVIPLPLGALITCIIWSMLYDFKASTETHCNVSNCHCKTVKLSS